EKFFQVSIALPKVQDSDLFALVYGRLSALAERGNQNMSEDEFQAIWDDGARGYFTNVRRVKLFMNKIGSTLAALGDEINMSDLVRLELIRDLAPSVYEGVYERPEYFFESEMAFEVRYRYLDPDTERVAKRRSDYYGKLISNLPNGSPVPALLERLFPG